MTETVMVLPLLLAVLAMLLYFGRGMVRVQRAMVMDRYESWRQAAGAPGPYGDNDNTNTLINQAFLGNNAQALTFDASDWYPNQASSQWIADAQTLAPDTGRLVEQVLGTSDHGASARFTSTFVANSIFTQRFEGPVFHGHTRLGHEWKAANSWRSIENRPWQNAIFEYYFGSHPWSDVDQTDYNVWAPAWNPWPAQGNWWPSGTGEGPYTAIADVFITDLDRALAAEAQKGNSLASRIQGLYRSNPGYIGPTVVFH